MKLSQLAVVVGLVTGLGACATGVADDIEDGAYEIVTLSSRPDMVTGGDALVAVTAPSTDAADLRIRVGEHDVTSDFQRDAEGRLVGLVSDLAVGPAEITVSRNGEPLSALPIESHPIEGPIFSGPHEQPFVCQTDEFELVSGDTLGGATDTHCSIERRVDYAYRSVDGELKKLDTGGTRPSDLATTTILTGAELPYIVRIETGTINLGIYQIAVLHDPATPSPDLWTQSSGWNGRLIYTFGGGCVRGWYRQGATTGGVIDDVMLRQGYALASSSLNVYGNNCNDVLAAETMMMVKERFIEGYGAPRFTIGWGCSGGSYQNHQIADNYPGLLDGIIPGCSFPDVAFGTIPMVADARLLNHYFAQTDAVPFQEEQQRAVTGFLTLATMPNVSRNAGRITVDEFCPDGVPEADRFHQVDNPNGVHCDVYSHYVNVYGRDAETGYARRPLDNDGVQYGLQSLNEGAITVRQFLDLNERIGGFDENGGRRGCDLPRV